MGVGRISTPKFSKFDENSNSIDLRNLINPKLDVHKHVHTYTDTQLDQSTS